MLDNFDEIRRELVFHISEYLDLYIKAVIICGKDLDEYKMNFQVIINILSELEQLREIDMIRNLH